MQKLQVEERLVPISVAVRSKKWICARSLAGVAGSNPAGGMDICSCGCCVLSGRGVCDGRIPHPQQPY